MEQSNMTPNKYTYIWAALAGAAVATETVALLAYPEATFTHHVRSLAKTHPRRLALTAFFAWSIYHFAYPDIRKGNSHG